MVNLGKSRVLLTGLLATTLAISGISAAQAVVTLVEVDGTSPIVVNSQATLYNATAGCSDTRTRWSSSNPDGLIVVSSTDDLFTVTTDTPGTYTFDIEGRNNNERCISHWTVIAALDSGPGPGAGAPAEAKKYAVTVTGYAYKKTGNSTLDERRSAAVSSYLQSLGLDSTNSTYSEVGTELRKNTRSARSAVVSVTYMKDGASVTVKKRIYFTAKKSTLSKSSKAKLNAFVSSVK